MILVITKSQDPSSNNVVRWLRHMGVEWFRVNSLETAKEFSFNFSVSSIGEANEIFCNGNRLDIQKITKVWFRRSPLGFLRHDLNYKFKLLDENVKEPLVIHLAAEKILQFKWFIHFLKNKGWLNHPEKDPSKPEQLWTANQIGLPIPNTNLLSTKAALKKFRKRFPKIITKPLSDILTMWREDESLVSFTKVIEDKHVEDLPDDFFPILVQEYLEKKSK